MVLGRQQTAYMALDREEIGYRVGTWLDLSWALFVGGTLASLLGFALPWFKWSARSQWWYSGWQLMRYNDLPGIAIIFVGYAALLLAGGALLRRDASFASGIALLSLTVTLAVLVVIGIAAADAIHDVRSMTRVVWSFGLVILLPGHAAMVLGAVFAWALQAIEDVLSSSFVPIRPS